jgi:hypothetical protein
MANEHTVVGTFSTHVEAENAVRELQKSDFNMHKISILGKDYQTTEHVRGFLTWKDTARGGAGQAGYLGAFIGGLFGILTGAGILFIPGIGPVIVAGHLVGVLAGWIEGMVVGGVGAAVAGGLLGALVGLGIPKEQALKYETEVKAGKFLVIVTGTDEDLQRAQQILKNAGHQVHEMVIG